MAEEKKYEDRDRPILESQYRKSKDGKYLIHRVTITTIKPVKYIEKVLEGFEAKEEDEGLNFLGED